MHYWIQCCISAPQPVWIFRLVAVFTCTTPQHQIHSAWCTCAEAPHPGLFCLLSIYSNITDNDPTYKTISTSARRMTWINDALRPIFTPITYLWQVERVADRYSRHRYQFQQALAELSSHTGHSFQTAAGGKVLKVNHCIEKPSVSFCVPTTGKRSKPRAQNAQLTAIKLQWGKCQRYSSCLTILGN